MVWYKKSNENAVLKIYQSAAKALLVKKRFKIFQNLVEVVKIERFSKREVQQVQTKKIIQTLSSVLLHKCQQL